MPEAENKNANVQEILEEGFKQVQGVAGALLKMWSGLTTLSNLSSQTGRDSASPSMNGNDSEPTPTEQDDSPDSSSTLKATASGSSLQKSEVKERTTSVYIEFKTFGNTQQELQDANRLVTAARVAGFDVESALVNDRIPLDVTDDVSDCW